MQSNILAIDLGTQMGFALGNDKIEKSGIFNLKKLAAGGITPFAMFQALDSLEIDIKDTKVVVEIVVSHGKDGAKAAQFYGAALFCLRKWCYDNKIPLLYVGVSTIKKLFTGDGRATKKAMADRARELGFQPKNTDEADAIAIWHVAYNYPEKLKEKF